MWYINRFEFKKKEREAVQKGKSRCHLPVCGPSRHYQGQECPSRRGVGGRESLAALKLCLQAFAYQLISHNQQRDQCALAKYLPRLQYGSVQFCSCAPVWFVNTPPLLLSPQSISPTRLSLSLGFYQIFTSSMRSSCLKCNKYLTFLN